MNLNSDFGARAAVHAARLDWTPLPTPGVDRRMLDRIGDEVARATSIVRYAPHSHFPSHTHGGGEEFLVLDGVFQDEQGDDPAGTYVRNPPTSSHTPGSEPGCTIFVKLWQFDPDDRTPARIDTSELAFAPAPAFPGVEFALLYESAWELVLLERWAPGINIAARIPGASNCSVSTAALSKAARSSRGSRGSGCRPVQSYKPPRDRAAAKSGSSRATSRVSHGCQLPPDLPNRFSGVPEQSATPVMRLSWHLAAVQLRESATRQFGGRYRCRRGAMRSIENRQSC
jgi:hypothetical protein